MYKCLKKNAFKDDSGYEIVTIRSEDIESIRQWRNAQIEVLRQQAPISIEEQQLYFNTHIWPTFSSLHPKQILFSYLLDGICIGYGGLVSIDWISKRAEVSILMNPTRLVDFDQYTADCLHFFALMTRVAFENLRFHRLCSETFAFREYQIRLLEQFGFKVEGRLREHVYKKGTWHDSILHGLLARETVDAKVIDS